MRPEIPSPELVLPSESARGTCVAHTAEIWNQIRERWSGTDRIKTKWVGFDDWAEAHWYYVFPCVCCKAPASIGFEEKDGKPILVITLLDGCAASPKHRVNP